MGLDGFMLSLFVFTHTFVLDRFDHLLFSVLKKRGERHEPENGPKEEYFISIFYLLRGSTVELSSTISFSLIKFRYKGIER